VKTIRFYSDSGVVPPTDRTRGGYRLYGVGSLARLELVRTLRELGAGLPEIERVLGSETTLAELAEKHLALLDDQMRRLRTRRAVLRAVVKQHSTTEEIRLMNKLATMSDAERNRLIDEFWDEVTEGLNVNPEFIAWMRSAKPALPDDPTTEQVEAWIELAELVQEADFRELVRSINAEQASLRDEGKGTQAPKEHSQEDWEVQEAIIEAHRAGTAPDSAEGVGLADRFAAMYAEGIGKTNDAELREQIASDFEGHDPRLSRYWVLLGTINDWPRRKGVLSGADTQWLAAALRASAHR
jgi:DNA-binding transcriptional MerR regulator